MEPTTTQQLSTPSKPEHLSKLKTRQSLPSISSSRPAPPSPSASSTSSRPPSQHSNSSRGSTTGPTTFQQNIAKRQSKLQNEILIPTLEDPSLLPSPKSPQPQPKSPSGDRKRSIFLRIRDFAFPPSDDRYRGDGPDVPIPNKRPGSELDPDFGGLDEKLATFGGGDAGTGWRSLIPSIGTGAGVRNSTKDTPSTNDFARNFDASSPIDDDAEEDGYEDDLEDDEDGEEDLGPLVPGHYRAVFPFEPEGSSEMALEEGQVVNVVGRGGGVGWAVVQKDDGTHALVPESYLEPVEHH